jgi:PAS domain S-box-containing protein
MTVDTQSKSLSLAFKGGLVSHTSAGLNVDHDALIQLIAAGGVDSHTGPEGIAVADATEPDLPLTQVSEGFLRLTGYKRNEVIGFNCRFLQGPATDQRSVDFIRRGLESERPVVVTLLNYKKNQVPFWNRLAINPVWDSDGRLRYFAAVSMDVTALRQAEQHQQLAMIEPDEEGYYDTAISQFPLSTQLSGVEELANQQQSELRDLLATLTHELRRPSLSLSGLLKLIKADAGDAMNADQHESLDLAFKESDRMRRLIDRLGEMLTVEETPLLPERINPSQLIDSIVSYLQPLSKQYGTRIMIDETCDQSVFVSRFQVSEAITNLIKNAIIHGSACENPEVHIRCQTPPGSIRIEVIDNGPGVPEAMQDRIFGLFSRATADPDRPGDGIGLAIVRRLISRVGGTVHLTSKPGEGCLFVLNFPVETA